jgi:hypothetical protein
MRIVLFAQEFGFQIRTLPKTALARRSFTTMLAAKICFSRACWERRFVVQLSSLIFSPEYLGREAPNIHVESVANHHSVAIPRCFFGRITSGAVFHHLSPSFECRRLALAVLLTMFDD